MNKKLIKLLICGCLILISCASSAKKNPLIGKWEEYKQERKNPVKEEKIYPNSHWEFTETEFFDIAFKDDKVNYYVKDSTIFIKGTAWYKIEKLTEKELIVSELNCDEDLCYRSYFTRVKKWKNK